MNDLLSLISLVNNPRAILNVIANNPQFMRNNIVKNTFNMASQGNMQGVEALARNLCEEKGINIEELLDNLKKIHL